MTYDDFLQLLSELKISVVDDIKTDPYRSRKNLDPKAPYLQVQWHTGGMSGGNCWDSSEPRPYTSDEQPPELGDLDKVLERLQPSITFLQYKKLCSQLLITGSYSHNEYYGNSSDYAYKAVSVPELYAYCKDQGWI